MSDEYITVKSKLTADNYYEFQRSVIFHAGSKKEIKEKFESDEKLQKEEIYTIKPDGLETKTSDVFSDVKWSALYAFQETENLFLVYTLYDSAYIIPKESFEGDSRKMELARSYLSNLPSYRDKNASEGLIRSADEEYVMVKVELTDDNLYECQEKYIKNSRWSYLLLFWTLLFALTLVFIIIRNSDRVPAIMPIIMFYVFWIVIITIAVILIYMSFRVGSKKGIRKQVGFDERKQQEYIFIIKPDGLEVETPDAFADIKWIDFYAFKETDTLFLVYMLHNQSYIIPKESFEGDDRKIELARNYFSCLPT